MGKKNKSASINKLRKVVASKQEKLYRESCTISEEHMPYGTKHKEVKMSPLGEGLLGMAETLSPFAKAMKRLLSPYSIIYTKIGISDSDKYHTDQLPEEIKNIVSDILPRFVRESDEIPALAIAQAIHRSPEERQDEYIEMMKHVSPIKRMCPEDFIDTIYPLELDSSVKEDMENMEQLQKSIFNAFGVPVEALGFSYEHKAGNVERKVILGMDTGTDPGETTLQVIHKRDVQNEMIEPVDTITAINLSDTGNLVFHRKDGSAFESVADPKLYDELKDKITKKNVEE